MKNKFSRILLLSLFALYSTASCAESGWIAQAKVIKVVATYTGGVNVRLSPDLTACVSQSGYGPNYASLYPDHPGKDKITSILLAAYIADKTVAIYFTDSSCKIGEVELGGR